jgi:acyl-CoA reductase-like NAD-dependent aldehyde dehydrogenase
MDLKVPRFPFPTGNTCVIKPPSIDSGIGLKVAQVLSEVDLPPGVINVITGPGGAYSFLS